MKKIKLLDCTLRDGGSLNHWTFGENSIQNIIQALNDSFIDIIELGFIDNNTQNNPNSVLKPDNTYFDNLQPLNKQCKTCAMIDFSKYDTEKFNITPSEKLNGLRVMFKKEMLKETITFCKRLKELNYEVSLNPVSVTRYSKDEFLKLIDCVNNLLPKTLYIVDTYGIMRNKETLEYFELIDKNLDIKIEIGYHSHDSMQLSLSNSINIINQNTDRTIIIDCALYGMGKRAGNTKTEILAEYLNRTAKKNYNLKIINKIIQSEIFPLQKKYNWGYSILHFISAINKCNSDYALYLNNEKHLPTEKINELLKLFDEEKKLSFDKNYADFIASHNKKW